MLHSRVRLEQVYSRPSCPHLLLTNHEDTQGTCAATDEAGEAPAHPGSCTRRLRVHRVRLPRDTAGGQRCPTAGTAGEGTPQGRNEPGRARAHGSGTSQTGCCHRGPGRGAGTCGGGQQLPGGARPPRLPGPRHTQPSIAPPGLPAALRPAQGPTQGPATHTSGSA